MDNNNGNAIFFEAMGAKAVLHHYGDDYALTIGCNASSLMIEAYVYTPAHPAGLLAYSHPYTAIMYKFAVKAIGAEVMAARLKEFSDYGCFNRK